MAVFFFFCWLNFSLFPGRTTQSHVKMETPSSVGRTGKKCAPAAAESPSGTLCRASLHCWPFTTPLLDVFAAIVVVQIEGEKWNGIREWKKAIPASISLSLLKKMSNHGSGKQNLWGVLLQAEKAASEGRRALICAFQPTAFQFTAGLYLSFINLGVFLDYSVVCTLHFTGLDVYFLFP